MDIAEPISPTPPTPIPSLSPKLAALTPPEPVEDHHFLFQRGPSQPSLYTSNSSDPDTMRKRKKTRNDGISNSQWLQLLSKLNHTNDNPLGWIEAIGAITQILTINVDNIMSTQSDQSILSKERVHITNITDQLTYAVTRLGNSASYPTSSASAQSSLKSKIDEINRKINSLTKVQPPPTTKTYAKATASGTQHPPPRQTTPSPSAKKTPTKLKDANCFVLCFKGDPLPTFE